MNWTRTRTTGLAALAVALGASAALGQLPAPSATGVRDRAHMFSPEAVAKAERLLRDAERSSDAHWQTVIETRPSLGGRDIATAAASEAEKSGIHGIYVLIARDEKKFHIAPGESAQNVFTAAERRRIVQALESAFKKGDFDAGLLAAAAEIRRAALGVGVRDNAHMFTPEAVAKADAVLEEVREKTGRQVLIETVPTLGGQSPSAAAADAARKLGIHGLYVLIAAKEKATFVEPTGTARETFTPERTRAINEALDGAFKAKQFDKGLLDAVALIAKYAASDPVSRRKTKPTKDDLIANDPISTDRKVLKVSEPTPNTLSLPGPSIPDAPGPAPQPPVAAVDLNAKPKGSSLMPLVIGGLVVVFLLWLVSRAFRRAPAPPYPQAQPYPQNPAQPEAQMRPGGMPASAPGQPFPPGAGPGPGPGPGGPGAGARPGYGQPPAPGYGYGQPPAPGYGYGQPPAAGGGGGGGVVSSALGGIGGAILGNVLYDKFGRPHEAPPDMPHAHGGGGVAPPEGGWPQHTDASSAAAGAAGAGAGAGGAAVPPHETYDPAAGTGGSWGDAGADTGSDAGSQTPDAVGGDWGSAPAEAEAEPEAVSGDWGSPDAGTGGDWGDPDAPPADDSGAEPTDQGGDWGDPDAPPADDSGGDGGDWSGGSDEQGGSW